MAAYTIEADYCTDTEIEEQLRELLFDYHVPFEMELSGQGLMDNPDYDDAKRKSDIALATLQDMFPGADEVQPGYLREQYPGTEDHVFESLRGLARDIQWPEDAADGKWCSTAEDTEECREKVALFMERGLWPFTNVVR